MDEPRIVDLEGFNKLVRGRDALYVANANDAYVGRSLLLYGEYCQEEYDLLSRITGPGGFVAEVGANLGAHTVRLARHVGISGRVVAFEPQPPIFQAMCGGAALNGLMNVDAHPYGLGAEDRIVNMPLIDYRRPNNFGGLQMADAEGQGAPVPVRRFDDVYHWPRLDLLKIDVEGMELEVLKGARASVERFRPIVYFENDQRDKSPALLGWLFEAGYRMWWHAPALYNPDNYFANPENVFGPTRSLNVLAIHRSVEADIALTEITDPGQFPVTE